MKRMLFVSPVCPYPQDAGQNVRITRTLQEFGRHYAVTLVVPGPLDADARIHLESLCATVIAAEPSSSATGIASVLRDVLQLRTLRRPEVLQNLKSYRAAIEKSQLNQFDRIFLVRTSLSPLFRQMRRKTVVDLDDLEYKKWMREVRWYVRRPRGQLPLLCRSVYYYCRFFCAEVVAARQFLARCTASPEDAQRLKVFGARNVVCLPNGVDIVTRPPTRKLFPPNISAAFVGNLRYAPNLDAVQALSDEILPELGTTSLVVSIDILGAGVDDVVRDRFPALNFLGYVDDLPSLLSEYDVLLAPIRLGGGTKLKVLAAMAAGVPVITTRIGAEGLGLTHGKDVLLAQAPKGFADCLNWLHQQPGLGNRIAVEAYQAAQNRFCWATICDNALNEFDRLCEYA